MSVRQKECYECHRTVYTIDGKFAGKLVNGQFTAFTDKQGNKKLQEYNDMAGEQAHYLTCPVKLARRQAQQGTIVQAAPSVQPGQQQFAGREQSNTYVPQGYIQQYDVQGQVARPSPPVIDESKSTAHIGGIGEVANLIKLAEDVKEMKEKIGDMSNTLEMIAIALNINLPGREPTALGADE